MNLKLNRESKYTQIGRLKLFHNRAPRFLVWKTPCNCRIVELYWIGVTWLSRECLP
jgi:hypothetical protein